MTNKRDSFLSKKFTIKIDDDLDLEKIMNSGQAFRIKKMPDDSFRFVYGEHILYIKPESSGRFSIETVNCLSPNITAADEWKNAWSDYFDLERKYRDIRKKVPASDSYMKKACENGEGLRILRQDPWEMLVTFIISQRKSIPAIKDAVEKICEKYGKKFDTGHENIFLFPSARDMEKATEAELTECKLGYRVSYIRDAIDRVLTGGLDLNALYALSYEEAFERLKEVRGVGDKVSNCICLFAYSKTEAAPVDTWIAKVIEQEYAGANPFPSYGDAAGIMQQYIFYYALTHKDSL